MVNEKIKNWLESEEKDFDAGLQLFVEFNKNRSIQLYLIRKRDIEKLTYELEKLAPQVKTTVITEEKKQEPEKTGKVVSMAPGKADDNKTGNDVPLPPVKTEGDETTDFDEVLKDKKITRDELPDDLKTVYDSIMEAYKEQRTWHEKMKLATTDESRAEMRANVIRCDDIIAEGWDTLEDWKTKGNETEITDPVEISKKINAARTYISKNLPKVPTIEGDKQTELIGKIKERVETLTKFNAELDASTKEELSKIGIN